MPPAPIAVVLAAGKGTRMASDLPKVLHEAAGKPLVAWVLDALAAAGIHDRIVVVGYRADLVEQALAGEPGVSFAMQREQRGTGDAVAAAADAIRERIAADAPDSRRPVVIVCGDSPMLRPESVAGLLAQFSARGASWADRHERNRDRAMSAAQWRRAMNGGLHGHAAAGSARPPVAVASSVAGVRDDPNATLVAPRGLQRLGRHVKARHVMVLALLLILPFVATPFMTFQVAAQSLVLGLIALSLTFLGGYGGMVSLAQMSVVSASV